MSDDTTPPDAPETNFGNMAEQNVQDGSGVAVAHVSAMRVKERLHERMMRLGVDDIPPVGIVDDTTPPEVGLDGFPLASPIETGSILAHRNRTLTRLCTEAIHCAKAHGVDLPADLLRHARSLGIVILGEPSEDSARVSELIRTAGF